MNLPDITNNYLIGHAELLISSYQYWTGRALVPVSLDQSERHQFLFSAPFALVSHGTQSDPIFNYANLAALELFEMDWDTFTQLPSRKSAEPVNRAERKKIMSRVTSDGYIDDYSGIRISSSGKRFLIEQATVWNIIDSAGIYMGQAARFSRWKYI